MSHSLHRFHIPVMGLGYTIDTPIKVAHYGISAVMSIVQDDLIEKARSYYCRINDISYQPITTTEKDYRSKRITAYLDLVQMLVNQNFETLKNTTSELEKYGRMLPNPCTAEELIKHPELLQKGSIDVNIMTKLDRQPSKDPEALTEASAALKGYAESKLSSSLVLSAGLNPRLFDYMQHFPDFYPDAQGQIKKKIVIKVSDYRSALVQGKMLAKKGLWVSEYRIESGLNCGGHTFATQGLLLGPILAEFKTNREAMLKEQLSLCAKAWDEKGLKELSSPQQLITVQGGIGNNLERQFLEDYFEVDATGWGSPFLLVPEATSLDDQTIMELAQAGEDDIYISQLSPLGVNFTSIRNNHGEKVRKERIEAGKPGSPCTWKHLAFDTSYDDNGQCTASIAYQRRRIRELEDQKLTEAAYQEAFNQITAKECLCDGLVTSFLKKFDLMDKKNVNSVSVCPGPNLAYFDRTYSLEEMVGHIYGKMQVIQQDRPHMFIKELGLYVEHFEKLRSTYLSADNFDKKEERRLNQFRDNLLQGIAFYEELMVVMTFENDLQSIDFENALADARVALAVSDKLEALA